MVTWIWHIYCIPKPCIISCMISVFVWKVTTCQPCWMKRVWSTCFTKFETKIRTRDRTVLGNLPRSICEWAIPRNRRLHDSLMKEKVTRTWNDFRHPRIGTPIKHMHAAAIAWRIPVRRWRHLYRRTPDHDVCWPQPMWIWYLTQVRVTFSSKIFNPHLI